MIENKIEFDADLSPDSEHNKEVAKIRRLVYDYKRKVYVDEDGCPARDRFGQTLG